MCVVYDRDGARGEACAMLASSPAYIELPAKRCPRWVLPNRGGASLFEAVPNVDGIAAIARLGWSVLRSRSVAGCSDRPTTSRSN